MTIRSCSVSERNEGRNSQRAETGRQALNRATEEVLLMDLPLIVSLLACSTQDHLPRGTTTHSELGLLFLRQSTIKKMLHGFAHRAVRWRQFLNRSFLLPNGSSLYQNNIKQHRYSYPHIYFTLHWSTNNIYVSCTVIFQYPYP